MTLEETKFSRRRLLSGLAGSAVLSVIAACAPAAAPTEAPKTQPVTAPTTAPTAAAKPAEAQKAPATGAVKITFWTHNYQPLMNYAQMKIPEFKQANPNVDVEYSFATVPDHQRKLLATLAAGAGFPDVFNQDEGSPAWLLEKGWVAVIPPESFGKTSQKELQDLFFDYSLVTLVRQGDLYAAPFEWNGMSLYYNRKHFADAGLDPNKPPTDWVTLTEYAAKLTKIDSAGNLTRPGWQQHYGPGTEWPYKRLHPLVIQLGGDVLSQDGKTCLLNTPEAIEAIQLYTDWTVKHKVSKKGFDVPGVSESNQAAMGYRSMWASGCYYPAQAKTANPDFKFKEDWDIANWPQWPASKNKKVASNLWRWGVWIAEGSEHKLEAGKWIATLVSDQKNCLQVAGYMPSFKGWQDQPWVKDMPWIPTQMKDLEIAVPVPQTPKYPEMAQQILEMLERVETGQQTVKQSADEATQKINVLLNQ